MTEEELKKMTKAELSEYKQKLNSEITKLTRKISERKKYLKEVRNPKLTYAPDEQLEQLKHEFRKLSVESSNLKEYKKMYNARLEAEQIRSQLELRKAQDEALKYDRYRERLADERRPKGERVWMGSEFKKLRPAEKRFIMLMAREIGQERYQELRRIAFYDEKHNKNRYYTGSNVFNGGEGADEPETNTKIQ